MGEREVEIRIGRDEDSDWWTVLMVDRLANSTLKRSLCSWRQPSFSRARAVPDDYEVRYEGHTVGAIHSLC